MTKEEFRALLLDTLHADQDDADKLYDKVDAGGTGRVTFGELSPPCSYLQFH